MHLKIKVIFVGTCIAVLSLGGNAFASSFADVHGFSARGIAMGNAMTAIVNDWSSVYYNMAGLGKTVHNKSAGSGQDLDMGLKRKKKGAVAAGNTKSYINELYLGMMYVAPMLTLDHAPASYEIKATDGLNYGILNIGLAVDLNIIYKMPKFISSARLGVGMGTPADGSVAKVNDIDPDSHNFMRYGREAQMAKIMVGFGFGFLDDMFGVGLGVNASFSGEGSVVMNGVDISATPQAPESDSRMDLALSPSIVAGLYFDFSKVVPILNGLQVGASYRQETAMQIDPFDAAAIVPDTMQMQMALAIFDYYAPHTVTAGVAYTRWGLTVSADVEIAFWKYYQVSSSVEVNNPDLPNLQNIIIPKIGFSYEALDWLTLMTGYTYQPSFIPDGEMSGDADFLDNDKHIFSLGSTFKLGKLFGFGGPIEITVAYQFQLLPEREVIKADSTSENEEPDYAYGGTCHAVSIGFMLKL